MSVQLNATFKIELPVKALDSNLNQYQSMIMHSTMRHYIKTEAIRNAIDQHHRGTSHFAQAGFLLAARTNNHRLNPIVAASDDACWLGSRTRPSADGPRRHLMLSWRPPSPLVNSSS